MILREMMLATSKNNTIFKDTDYVIQLRKILIKRMCSYYQKLFHMSYLYSTKTPILQGSNIYTKQYNCTLGFIDINCSFHKLLVKIIITTMI